MKENSEVNATDAGVNKTLPIRLQRISLMRARKKLFMAVETKEKLNALEALEEIDKRFNLDPDFVIGDFGFWLMARMRSLKLVFQKREHHCRTFQAILSGFLCSYFFSPWLRLF